MNRQKENKMKFKTLLIIAIAFMAFLPSCVDEDVDLLGNWVTKSYYGGYTRADGTSFAINGIGYWGMGRDVDDYFSDFYKYDPAKDTWIQVADFPGTPRAYNISVSNGSKGYVGLGYDGNNDLNDMWEYDAEKDKWTQLDDFPGGARRFATAFAIGNDIYVGTGSEDNNKKFLNDFYKYNGASWELIPSLSGEKRINANAVVHDGKAHIISGQSRNGVALDDHWVYDPSTDVWSKLDKLSDDDTGNNNIKRYNATAFSSNGKIYLVAGNTGGSTQNTVFEWDSTRGDNGMWIEKTSIETGISREGAGSFVLDGYGYIVGGRSGSNFRDDCYMFQPYAEADSDDN